MLELTPINNIDSQNPLNFPNICPPAYSAVSLGRKSNRDGKKVVFNVDWELEDQQSGIFFIKLLLLF